MEVIGLGLSDDAYLFLGKAIVCCVIHIGLHYASPKTPLYICYTINRWIHVTPSKVSAIFKNTVTYLGPTLSFLSTNISTRYL